MIRRTVGLAPQAEDDLALLYDWIAESASPSVALAYTDKLKAFLQNLDIGSERGTPRDDIQLGLRILGFRRRVTIAFTVTNDRVIILRLFYRGRDWQGDLTAEDDNL